jgi:lipopolysaccharide biosynthesis protein
LNFLLSIIANLPRAIFRWFRDRWDARYSWRSDTLSDSGGFRPDPTRQLCLFAHFDPDGRIDSYVLHYLKELRERLKADIVFVTASPVLDQADRRRVAELTRRIIHRRNRALDFGSWNTAIRHLGWQEIEQYRGLLIANDSVYGPFQSLSRVEREMDHATPDPHPVALGLTASEETEPHLQSYFLWFNQAAVRSSQFRRFWNRFIYHRSKHRIIMRCEIGLSRTLRRAGASLISVFDGAKALAEAEGSAPSARRQFYRSASSRAPNPTQYAWRTLIEHMGFPFVKADILKRNPCELPDTHEILPLIRRISDYDTEMIVQNVRRVGESRWI